MQLTIKGPVLENIYLEGRMQRKGAAIDSLPK